VPLLHQLRAQPTADEAGRTGDEYSHVVSLPTFGRIDRELAV
jgi:hypothetical protein